MTVAAAANGNVTREIGQLDTLIAALSNVLGGNKLIAAFFMLIVGLAVTMGIGTIMAARKVVLVASGAEKAPIVKEAFFGPVTPQVPASILQMHPDVTLVADEAALSLVK